MAPRINIPPITRGLLILLVTLSLLNAYARYYSWQSNPSASLISRQYIAPYLTLVPGRTLPRYPWAFFTATFVEQNIAGLLITGSSLFYGGRYLERGWSSNDYTKFILITALMPNFASWAIYITTHIITGNEGASTTGISGGVAIQGGFLVAFKQLVPEHTVNVANGLIKMRVKHFPAVFLLLNTLSALILGTDTAMLLAWFGFFASWVYLRFFRVSPMIDGTIAAGDDAALRGDASDTFAFAAFWPDVAQPYVEPVADAVYKTLVSLKLLRPFTADDVDAGNIQASVRSGGDVLPTILNRPRGRQDEAERRRALALRALDQRLQAATVTPPVVNLSGPLSLGETTYEPDEPIRPSSATGNV